MDFNLKLENIIDKNNSLLCVGLDTKIDKIPKILSKEKDGVLKFNKEIIDATKDLVCAYKPNMAFYEGMGIDGIKLLGKTIEAIPDDIVVILDAKRGDIGYTSEMYAKAVFDEFKADSVTVNPYLGVDALQPFIERPDKGIFVLCLTTNKGAQDFQKQRIINNEKDMELFLYVAERFKEVNKYKNIGLVVGATNPEEFGKVRETANDMVFLVPGIGAQGGDLDTVVLTGLRKDKKGLIINVTREIIYASSDSNFAEVSREISLNYRNRINTLRKP